MKKGTSQHWQQLPYLLSLLLLLHISSSTVVKCRSWPQSLWHHHHHHHHIQIECCCCYSFSGISFCFDHRTFSLPSDDYYQLKMRLYKRNIRQSVRETIYACILYRQQGRRGNNNKRFMISLPMPVMCNQRSS